METNSKKETIPFVATHPSEIIADEIKARGMKKTEFAKIAGLTPGTLAKLSKNQTVSMDSLIKMCKTLNCTFDDIVEIVSK